MVRLGVVGHGLRMSSLIKTPFRGVEPDLRVVAIVDPDEKTARAGLDECDRKDAVFYDSLDEMVRKAKLDALAIGTRCHMHAPIAAQAAQYGLPLFLEKPVAINMDQAVELEKAYENAKTDVLVSFPLRVSPLCRLTREKIQQGEIGSAEHIMAANYVPYGRVYFEMGYRNFDITQGLFLQKATHDLDYMSYLMGSKIVRVAASWTRGHIFGGDKPSGLTCANCDEADTCLESPQNRYRNGLEKEKNDHLCIFSVDCGSPKTGINEDASSALVEFESGAHGVYTQVFFTLRDAGRRGAIISGYHGTLDFDWYRNDLKFSQHHRPFTDTVKMSEGLGHFGGDTELAHNFFAMIQGKEKSQATVWDGIQSVYTCLAAKESAETGKFVKVRQVGVTN